MSNYINLFGNIFFLSHFLKQVGQAFPYYCIVFTEPIFIALVIVYH